MAGKENLSPEARLLDQVAQRYLKGKAVFSLQSLDVADSQEGSFGAVNILNFLAAVGNLGIEDAGEAIKAQFAASPDQGGVLIALNPWWTKLYRQTTGVDELLVEGDVNKVSLKFKFRPQILVTVIKDGDKLTIGQNQFDPAVKNSDLARAIVAELL